MLALGVHPKVASERLGHSRIAITLDLYSHVLPGMQQEAADKVDAALKAAIAANSRVFGSIWVAAGLFLAATQPS